MFHKNRSWSEAAVATAEELAEKLTEHTWCCCNGFRVEGTAYLFLNDATSADGAQEYAAVKELPDGMLVQVESITFGWCTKGRAVELIREVLAGQYDQSEFAHQVKARVETPEQHGGCPHCM